MRVSNEEMKKTHKKILRGSSRLLRARGIESTSVQDAMGEAGMKIGGFYRHFESKEALVDAALQEAFAEVVSSAASRLDKLEPDKAMAAYRSHYLSDAHVDELGTGCPVAALAGDVARAADPLKASFGAGLNQMIGVLSRRFRGSPEKRRDQALREFAGLVGAVVIARASDETTRRDVLAACRI